MVERANAGKFLDPNQTADGSMRARVPLSNPRTLWFNTGTLCNIACVNCYIESSPINDRLAFMTTTEVTDYLGQIEDRGWPVREIGFTGGEPFMNPEIIAILRASLRRGYDVLVLTNAMRPMMRKHIQNGLLELIREYGDKLTLRVSLDHWQAARHDEIRGQGSFDITFKGMKWLRDHGFKMAVAGRALWLENETEVRTGYGEFFALHNIKINSQDPAMTVIFPEMDEMAEVPEITTSCWGILGKSSNDIMCASARMVVKRKGAGSPVVLACTLLPYKPAFEMGASLADAEGDVALNHAQCARFCVMGGASCSG
ncbi:MAG: radical SAM protein [Rhodobacteraceae bacterium]|nr:radical SAM protein [Paracoccaceae bacterium]